MRSGLNGVDLEGIVVVSLEQAVAAPLASARLADAGARVIKVERESGDFSRRYDRMVKGQSAYFVWLNRGKESVVANIKDPEDIHKLRQLLAKADVFIENLKPGTMEKIGLPDAELHSLNPGLVICHITGFGKLGPRAYDKAYDMIMQAETGVSAITGTADSPARVGISICDISAGVTAHAAILQGLFARYRTGKGRTIEVSLFDSIADWMNVPYLQYLYGGVEFKRCGLNHLSIAPYGAYTTRDKREIIFSIQNEREWESFCAKVLGRREIFSDQRFHDNTARLQYRAELDEIITDRFSYSNADEITKVLNEAGIANGYLSAVSEAVKNPHLRFAEVSTPNGTISVAAPAPIVDGQEVELGSVPDVGTRTLDELIESDNL